MAGSRAGRGGLPGGLNRRRTWRNAQIWLNNQQKPAKTSEYVQERAKHSDDDGSTVNHYEGE